MAKRRHHPGHSGSAHRDEDGWRGRVDNRRRQRETARAAGRAERVGGSDSGIEKPVKKERGAQAAAGARASAATASAGVGGGDRDGDGGGDSSGQGGVLPSKRDSIQ